MLRLLPILVVLSLLVPGVASAATGQRDPSFGSGGEFRLAGEPVRAVARQADGRLVLAGERRVYRLTANGNLDLTFGTSGFVTPAGADRLRALVLQPDGRIVVGGSAGTRATLWRFDAAGQPDAAFGTSGRATLTTTTATEQVTALALAAEDKLVVAGEGAGDSLVWRRRGRDGAPDANFNAGGRLAITFAADSTETATALAVQPNGRILLAGSTATDAFIARLHPVAGLDPAYPGAGKQRLNLGGTETAAGLLLQPDGKLVVTGRTSVGANGVVWRFQADGLPDDTFNDAGVQFLELDSSETLGAPLLQPDGKLVLPGSTGTSGAVHRLTGSGRRDPTFDADGTATINAAALTTGALQDNGNVVVAGTSGADGVLYRLFGDPFRVTASTTGNGALLVNGSACTFSCTHLLDPGTNVELRAVPFGGSYLAVVLGAPCGLPCSYAIDRPLSIHARFESFFPAVAATEPERDTSAPKITRARLIDRTVRFTLSEAATTTATVKRGGRVITRARGTKSALTLRKRLTPGRYRITLVATDAAGNRSKPVTLTARR
ncbi:hypothetical protein OJ997_18045 [Solirubrobacter phytolaccae]|uniref:Delta-60 repeat domain-containing protein n=1 Tax=Solirubrobacter phytolaccae TaxID=1404360 RepID=A0A9X3N9F4_9ACTN|nr:hypothetical protein [Solirubrobacter phytolaccae]MDA0182213.1 hypothetical protein [Solirubrobacter phytolaccae]